jgi:DNA repair exonuclease SbcCD ATPase subunit
MKIKLNNFKCWGSKILDIPDLKFSLISGRSGIGKTSIFEGILYCLYGIGYKVCKVGEKNCFVEFEYENLIIKRTKKTRVTLKFADKKVEYEDAIAQEIINDKFGNHFDITGYIRQNGYNSFILLSPQQRLEFLESIVLNKMDLRDKKFCLKKLIKENELKLYGITSRLELVTEQLSTLENPKIVKHFSEIYIEKFKEKKVSNDRKISIIEDKLHELEFVKIKSKNYFEKLVEYKNSEKNFKESQKSLEKELFSEQDLSKFNEQISYINQYIKSYEYFKSYNTKKRELQDLQTLHSQTLLQKKEKIENRLQEIGTVFPNESYEEIQNFISNQMLYYQDLLQVKKIFKKLQILDKNSNSDLLCKEKELLHGLEISLSSVKNKIHKKELEKFTYSCPECHTHLNLKKGNLIKVEESQETIFEDEQVLKTELQQFENKISEKLEEIAKLEEKIFKIKNLEENVLEIKSGYITGDECDELEWKIDEKSLGVIFEEIKEAEMYLQTQTKNQEEKNALEKSLLEGDLSDQSTQIIVSKIFGIQSELNLLESPDIETSFSEKDYSSYKIELVDIQQKLQHNKEIEKEHDFYKSRLTELEITISEFKRGDTGIFTESSIQKSIEKNKQKLENYKKQKDLFASVQGEIDEYLSKSEILKKFNSWDEKLTKLKFDEKHFLRELDAAMLLKTKIAEAESIAIQNSISSLNSIVQDFISHFFEDDSFTINLSAFKETQKGEIKPEINLQIIKNDTELEKEMLSGGEMQRIILAFNLALSEICNTPFILLDECTSNLDAETTSDIIEGIKTHYPTSKTILMIGHQVVSGVFDNCVELKL